MKYLLLSLLAFVPCLLFAEIEEGFTPLTNGKDLTGWKKVGGNGEYKMEDGEIVGMGRKVNANTFLISEKTYGNYDFRFEMKFDTLKGNSGMMFRGLQKESTDGNGRVHGYQCEHDNGKGRAWTAGLYDEARRGWLFPDKKDDRPTSLPADGQASGMIPEREELRKKAAAAGVAVLLEQRSLVRKGRLGSELEKPVGRWWQRGLDRIHSKE